MPTSPEVSHPNYFPRKLPTFRAFPTLRFLGLLFPITVAVAVLSACGNQNSTPPAIAVTFTPGFIPPTAMTPNDPCGVAATVANDSKNQGVKWTVVCTGTGCGDGSFSPTQFSASTEPITYTSPTTASTVTLTATSVTDPTKFLSTSAIPIGQNSDGCVAP